MMMTDEWVRILEEAESLSDMIVHSEEAARYRASWSAVYENPAIAADILAFARLKETYEEVERFGKYHPDYTAVMAAMRREKRRLDTCEEIANYRFAEVQLQDLLDEVALVIAAAASESVPVPVSNPFLKQSAGGGCETGCGSGGSCSCSSAS